MTTITTIISKPYTEETITKAVSFYLINDDYLIKISNENYKDLISAILVFYRFTEFKEFDEVHFTSNLIIENNEIKEIYITLKNSQNDVLFNHIIKNSEDIKQILSFKKRIVFNTKEDLQEKLLIIFTEHSTQYKPINIEIEKFKENVKQWFNNAFISMNIDYTGIYLTDVIIRAIHNQNNEILIWFSLRLRNQTYTIDNNFVINRKLSCIS